MKQTVCLFVTIVVLIGINLVDGHSYHLGVCPIVEPMHGFDISKFLGIWYVIQKTSTGSSCITYNFTRSDEPGHYEIEQVSQHFGLRLTPLKHDYRYKGQLSMSDPSVPARMTVRFPLSVAGSASYTVIGTDYSSYAGVFTCQSFGFGHRQSATILSRQKTLDKSYVDKVRSRLSSSGVDPFELSIISQNDCPRPGDEATVNINIDDQTFTAKSAAEVVRKAGEKIGDGIEYIAGGAKKLYNTVSSSSSDHSMGRREYLHSSTDPKSETEWLP